MDDGYADLEIRIFAREEKGFPVEITLDEQSGFERGYLDPACLSFVPSVDPSADGEQLFTWLLCDPRLKSTWDYARGRNNSRRIRLRIDNSAPELHALPWELLREPGSRGLSLCLAAGTATPFSRYLATSQPLHKPVEDKPLRVLVAIAAPAGLERFHLAPVDAEQEWKVIQQATEHLGALEVILDRLSQPCSLANLQAVLNRGYHIFHFVGHGTFHKERGVALFLADEQNQVNVVGEEELASYFAHLVTDTSGNQSLRLVYLSSCATATRSPSDAFLGLAPKMVEAGLAAVVAMQEPVPMDTAQVFARNFYSGLFSHGLVDKAANEARQAVNAHRLWGAHIPVLFMRLPDGRLFTDNTFPLSPNIVESINLTPDDYRNLEDHRNLRQKVKRNWIEGLLQSSLYKEVFIHVGLQDRPSSVHNPLRQYCFHHSARPDVILPPSAHIIDMYERMGQMLLILGEPGSGKTTVLLELARELLVRSMTKQLSPTPVVFNLSSWVECRTPLAEWLVEELNVLYSVDKDRARLWLENKELILLLDGLDEVQQKYREECIEAINQFHQDDPMPLVVCCRLAEYEALSVKLGLEGAVLLQPLTPDQIADYVSRSGNELSGLCTALQYDPELMRMASSPFMLNIMILVYQGWSAEAVSFIGEAQTSYQYLFDTYIERMFLRQQTLSHHRDKHSYAPHETLRWLRWLADQMVEHGQTIFLIERMQPSWFSQTNRWSPTGPLFMAAWGPVYGLVVGGVLGLLFGLVYLLLNPATGTVSIGMNVGPVSGLVLGLIVGAFLGLLAGVVDGLGGGFRLIQPVSKMSQSWVALRRCLYAGLFWGLFQGLTFYLLIDIGAEPSNAFQLGLIGVLVGSVIAGFRPVKLARWSGWTSSIDGWTRSNNLLERQRSGLVFGLLVGLSFSLLIGLVVGLLSGLEYGLLVMLTAAWTSVADIRTVTVPVGLMGGVLFGTLFEPKEQAELVEPAETQTPNQGIKLSVQNALKLGICFGVVGLGIGLWLGWSLGELYLGLIFGLFLGLGGGLIGGADSVVKHYILRALLYSEGLIPHHYARFLDYCVKMTFLHRSGGSYLFIHRLFMEHVAQLDDDRIAAISRNVKSFQE